MYLKYDPPHIISLKINYDDISNRDDPYQLFLDGIKSTETERKYKKLLERFLHSIPEQVYDKSVRKNIENSDINTNTKVFVDLAKQNSNLVTNIIATYIKEEKKLVESGNISSGTLENHIKPIKVLLDSNRVAIHWKSLRKLYPRKQSTVEDRAYTKQELQKMLDVAHDITDKVIITLFSSGGFRLEAWNYFTWKDLKMFKNEDGSYKGGALRIYANDQEEYWTHITPEACKYIKLYTEKWKTDIGEYPKKDQPLLKAVKYPTIHRLNSMGVKKRIEKLAKSIGMRQSLPEGKKRYDVPLDHGFRKYFNTMMRRAKVNFLDKEDMMGHKVGLERHYERYQEEDFERFPEYQKAIPFLTISDEDRLRYENQQKQGEIEYVQKKNEQLEGITKIIEKQEKTQHESLLQKMDSMQKEFNKKIESLEKERMYLNDAFESLLPNEKDPKKRQQMRDIYRLLTITPEEIQQHLEAN